MKKMMEEWLGVVIMVSIILVGTIICNAELKKQATIENQKIAEFAAERDHNIDGMTVEVIDAEYYNKNYDGATITYVIYENDVVRYSATINKGYYLNLMRLNRENS